MKCLGKIRNKISIIIINWNGGKILYNCVDSIVNNFNSFIYTYELIIFDNASEDFIEKDFIKENIKIITSKTNLGFAKALNISIQKSKGEYLLLMNNDVILGKNFFPILFSQIKENDYDALTPKFEYCDGSLQKSIWGFPSLSDIYFTVFRINKLKRKFDNWENNYFNYEKKQKVSGYPMFAVIFLKKKIMEKVGLLDENLPLFWNDTDWFLRFFNRGFTCYYCPDLVVTHIHSMSMNRNIFKKIINSSQGMIYYFKKNYRLSFLDKMLLYIIITISFPIRILRDYIKYKL